jgi:tetratricopeptide (TPR) repeat protein
MDKLSSKIAGAEHLTEVIAFLQNADKFVRNGNVENALNEILKAREKNPTIMYTRAYEEYIRLILQRHKEQEEEGITTPESRKAIITDLLPTLEKILDIAIKEIKRSAASAYKEKMVISLQRKRDEELKKEELQRTELLQTKISAYLSRAKSYQTRNDFHSALNEIARAFMLNPTDDRIIQAEDQTRNQQDEFAEREQQKLLHQQHEDQQRRQHLFDEWNNQRFKQREVQTAKEEEEQKLARANKIREYLQEVRKHFSEGKIEVALSELAFVLVLDPFNEEVLGLNWQLREAQKKQHENTIAQKEKTLEEETLRKEAINKGIKKNLHRAEQYLAENRFSDALRIITQAYFIDPTNEEITDCENRIIAAEEEINHKIEEDRKRHEESLLRNQEAALHRITIAQQKREEQREKNEIESRLLREQEEILLYISKARGFYTHGRYEEALAQAALAFKIYPLNGEVIQLQEEILEAQKKFKAVRKGFPELIRREEQRTDDQTLELIRKHIEKAQRFRKEHLYQQSLDEIAQAYGHDPMNEELFTLEGEIQQEFLKYEEQIKIEQDLAEKNSAIKKSLATVRECLAKRSFSEALAWLDYTLSFDMYRPETLELKMEIERAMRQDEDRKANEDKELVIQFHLSRAMEFVSEQRYSEATLEVDLALRLNPNHPSALMIKSQIKGSQQEIGMA